MIRILVLCTGNSARSQLAQGYLQHFAGSRAEVYSAGEMLQIALGQLRAGGIARAENKNTDHRRRGLVG